MNDRKDMKDFPISEKFGKMKAEREKFYDALLVKILALPEIQDLVVELKKDVEWNLEHGWGEYEFEGQALDDFFEGDIKDILAVEEIWKAVQEAVRDDADWKTSDPKTFVEDGIYFKAEDIMNEKLGEISDELDKALKRRHGKT